VEKKLWGIPDCWSPPKPDPNWSLKTGKDELEMKYSEVDNPGGWSDYTFRPRYEKNVYVGHRMPAGARVVKDNGYGVRVEGEWEFFYNGWKLEQSLPPSMMSSINKELNMKPFHRVGCGRDNMFPDDRKGRLNPNLLEKMGLTSERMQECDALFFYQLLLPICDPSKSGVAGDPHRPFYIPVSNFTNRYAYAVWQLDGNYGHKFNPTNVQELLHFDGIVFRNTNDNIHDCWCTDDDCYDDLIANTMHHHQWIALRSCIKMNHNTYKIPRGKEGHDPCAKFRLV